MSTEADKTCVEVQKGTFLKDLPHPYEAGQEDSCVVCSEDRDFPLHTFVAQKASDRAFLVIQKGA